MSYITLSKNNFFHNLDIISKKTKSKDKIALVLKDNAYGHGLIEIASMAGEYGITKAVVKNEDEAIKIQNYFEYILILADFPRTLNSKFSYTINDLQTVSRFPKNTKVELKIDTGMHRNGIALNEIGEAKQKIQEYGLQLEAVFTHHRSADELTSEWFWQNQVFAEVKKEFKGVRFHSANSASLFRYGDFNEDMARVGVAAYGCLSMPLEFEVHDLKPVLSLYAQKISSRRLKKSHAVGYGSTYTLKEESVVSTYDFGYGDGFLRASSNNYTTPHGKELIGRISMDNASFIAEDENLLIFHDASEMAKSARTIAYEVLTSLKKKHYP
jgi:alanine racemase